MSGADVTSLPAFLEQGRAAVEAALVRYLPSPPACPPLLSEAMRYSLLAGGKRLRPLLVLAAADAVSPAGVVQDDILPAACAVEFIHTYSLIHDDLPAMDNDSMRRGRPTLHTVYGDGVAILAGDGLQAEAFSLVAREPRRDDPVVTARKVATIGILATAAGATGMVGGQTVDLQAAGQVEGHALSLTPDSLRAMHLQKTGALIRAAAVSGAIMAGGSAPTSPPSNAGPLKSDSPFRSSTTSSTSKVMPRSSGRPPARMQPTTNRPIRRCSASIVHAPWPPSAATARTPCSSTRISIAAGSMRCPTG
jgi:geranylgeranyl pyrophosphate synthase